MSKALWFQHVNYAMTAGEVSYFSLQEFSESPVECGKCFPVFPAHTQVAGLVSIYLLALLCEWFNGPLLGLTTFCDLKPFHRKCIVG